MLAHTTYNQPHSAWPGIFLLTKLIKVQAETAVMREGCRHKLPLRWDGDCLCSHLHSPVCTDSWIVFSVITGTTQRSNGVLAKSHLWNTF